MSKCQTNEFLSEVYEKVLDRLVGSFSFPEDPDSQLKSDLINQFAPDSGMKPVDLKLTGEEERDLERTVLYPVAKSYAPGLIRTMIDACGSGRSFSKEELEDIWDKMYGNKECAKRHGLKKREGDIVLGITKSVILDDALFEKPIVLTKDRKQYELKKDKDNFYVKPV